MLPSEELLEALSTFSHSVLFGSSIKSSPLPLTLMKAHPYQWQLCLCSPLSLELRFALAVQIRARRCWLIYRSALPLLSGALGLPSSPGRALALSLLLGSHLNFLLRVATFAAPWQEPLASLFWETQRRPADSC